MADLTGYSRDELLTMSGPDITHPDDVSAGIEVSRQMVNGNLTHARLDKRYVHADGRIISALVDISLVRDASGSPVHSVVQVQDVTEQKRIEAELAYHAYHDALTGLPNRRKLMQDLEERVDACRGQSRRCCSCSTSTGSRPTTTRTDIRRATRCWSVWANVCRPRCSAAARHTAWAGTSSACWHR